MGPAGLVRSNRGTTMDKMITEVFGMVLFYGLEIVAVLLLIGSAMFPRLLVVVIILGVVAAGCMAVESVIWWVMTHMDGSDPDWQPIFKILNAISIVSLLIYFPLSIARC
jgi:heme/copper-type cytochrome/quinol oxidase subunit 4